LLKDQLADYPRTQVIIDSEGKLFQRLLEAGNEGILS